MVSQPSSSITWTMRWASFLPSVPRQAWTLYDAIRRHSGPSCASSARQLARLLPGLAMLGYPPPHARETPLYSPGAPRKQRERAPDQPPVDVAAAADRGFDCVAEHRGGEGAGQQADRGADH